MLLLIHSWSESSQYHNASFPFPFTTNNPQAIVAQSVPTVTPRKPIAKAAASSPAILPSSDDPLKHLAFNSVLEFERAFFLSMEVKQFAKQPVGPRQAFVDSLVRVMKEMEAVVM